MKPLRIRPLLGWALLMASVVAGGLTWRGPLAREGEKPTLGSQKGATQAGASGAAFAPLEHQEAHATPTLGSKDGLKTQEIPWEELESNPAPPESMDREARLLEIAQLETFFQKHQASERLNQNSLSEEDRQKLGEGMKRIVALKEENLSQEILEIQKSLAQIKQHQARVLARVGAKTITPSENGTE